MDGSDFGFRVDLILSWLYYMIKTAMVRKHSSSSLSHDRQQVRRLYEEIGSLLPLLLDRTPLLAASLYLRRSRCGKRTCRCARGSYRHRLWCVSFLEDGRPRNRAVPSRDLPIVRERTESFRRFREARRQVERLCSALVRALKRLGQSRSKYGWQELSPGVGSKPARGSRKGES